MRAGLIPRYNWDYGLLEYFQALSGALGLSSSTEALESFSSKDVIMTSSGRASLFAIIKSLDLPEGSGIGVPLYCCPVVSEAILEAGMVPTYIDSERGAYNISAEDIRNKRDRISALVVVHMFGHPAEMDDILDAAAGIPVVEDCAQSLFSTYHGILTGQISGLSFFSFRSGKYLSAGEGSFILAKEPELNRRLKEIVATFNKRNLLNEVAHCTATIIKSCLYSRPWFGTLSYPVGRHLDRKMNLTSKSGFSAKRIARCDLSVIVRRLRDFSTMIEKQRKNAHFLLEKLEGCNYKLQYERYGCISNYYQFPIRLGSRDEKIRLVEHLFRNNIDVSTYLDDIVEIANRQFGYSGDCPFAEESSSNTLIVPHYYTLTHRDLNHIAGVLIEAQQSF